MAENNPEIIVDGDKIPFRVRPIDLHGAQNLHTKPVSIPEDLSGNLTLSSKHVAFPIGEFVEIIEKKDISAILAQKRGEEMILKTETILQISRAPDKDDDEIDAKKFWAVPAILGFLLATMLFLFWGKTASALFFAVAIAAVVLGFSAGFFWQIFWEKRLKIPFKKWVKENLE